MAQSTDEVAACDVLGAFASANRGWKVALYNGANREVAILCNHQRTVSSAQKEGLEKLQDRLDMLKRQKQASKHPHDG